MPLTPLDPSNTARILVEYECGELSHVAQIRLPDDTDAADALAAANDLIVAMRPAMYPADSVLGALFIPAGTNISQVLAVTGGAGTFSGGTNGANDLNNTAFLSFTGRSSDGRKVRFTMFSFVVPSLAIFREPITTAPDVFEDLWNAIQALEPAAVTISGLVPIWASYVNYGRNAHFQRSQR